MNSLASSSEPIEIIAFMLHDQQFCVRTASIREIRGWAPVTPLPHTPSEVMGVMNLRGKVIPIVDLAMKLGMPHVQTTDRSAIVVTNVNGKTIGLRVDRVSDILTVSASELQPIPEAVGGTTSSCAEGIIARDQTMICFLSLERIFRAEDDMSWADVA